MIEEFEIFKGECAQDLSHVMSLLSEKISDEPTQCLEDLRETEAWYSRMTFILAEANSRLDQFMAVNLPAKEGKTEYDRKIMLDSLCAPIREFRDKVEGLTDGIKLRISLGKVVMNFQKEMNVKSPTRKTETWT